IARHLRDRCRGEDPCAAMFALRAEHLGEREVVVRRRYEARGTGWERGRPAPLTGRRIVVGNEPRRTGEIARDEAVLLLSGDAERRVAHPERIEDPVVQERLERLTRGARDEHAEDI